MTVGKQGRDSAIAHVQRDRPDALAFGTAHQPFHIDVGMILGFVLSWNWVSRSAAARTLPGVIEGTS
jgi:hypothetical protein